MKRISTLVLITLLVLDFSGLLFLAPQNAEAIADLVRTDHINAFLTDTSGAFSQPTSSFTPPSNSLLVVVVTVFSGLSVAGNTSISDSQTLNWTERTNVSNDDTQWFWDTSIYTAPVTTGTSMTVTISNTVSADTDGRILIHIMSFTGYDTDTPVGGVVGDGDIGDGISGDITGAMTLSGTPVATSVTIASRYLSDALATNLDALPGSGWTEILETANTSGYGELNTQERLNSTSAAVAWTDINDGNDQTLGPANGVAIIINADDGPPRVIRLRGKIQIYGGTHFR